MSNTGEYTDIIKVGGAVLGIENDAEQLVGVNEETFDSIGREVSEDEVNSIAVVTSFAIGQGMLKAGLAARPDDSQVPELQRFATIGQPLVQQRWAEAISKTTGEVLLTNQEINNEQENAKRLAEILRTFEVLFRYGDVPVVNENDAITHEEITFGSNDLLASELAQRMQHSGLFGQVRLFLLTDVNGVYADKNDANTRIPVIENAAKYTHAAEGSDSRLSIGGMKSKLEAAIRARYTGIPTYIYNPADGSRERAVEGEIGTFFPAWAPRKD
jgi:glutamate 5-kinase